MRRGRTLIFVLLILVIGLAVGFFAIRQFLSSSTAQPVQPAFTEVYVAAQNIPQGGKITSEFLTTIKIAPENVVAVMFTADESEILLNNKVAKFPLDQGVVITESMVSDASAAVPISGPQWASLIPPGMTAMSIPMTRLSLSSYAINDGAHVNINACFLFVDIDPTYQTLIPNLTSTVKGTGFVADDLARLTLEIGPSGGPAGRLELDPSLQMPYYLIPSEPQQRPRMVCQMLLQDVLVLKLGNFPLIPNAAPAQAAPPADPAAAQQQQAAIPPPDLVTLIITPQDSITLSYLVYTNAKISLTLRNPTDQARQATEASTLQFLLSQYNVPVPAKLPYSMQPAVTSLDSPQLPNDAVTVPPQ